MAVEDAYIVVDFGTGNLRVAVVSTQGRLLAASRKDITYYRDDHYPDSVFFKPDETWMQVISLCRDALKQSGRANIKAITAASQREGIVLLNAKGDAFMGMPNIDHRGRQWESIMKDKNRIYQLTGRYPTSLFSALKLVGFKELYKDHSTTDKILSISDWIEYMFCGVLHYEHSQASETLLYDVAQAKWADELTDIFAIDKSILPPLVHSATLLGTVKADIVRLLGLCSEVRVIAGGADTQLAVVSTGADEGDTVIVSGTTTPIVKLTNSYIIDRQQRTWTGRHTEDDFFMIEANAGVTGLNYQRLKKIFYPNEGYDIIERELSAIQKSTCTAALGSLLADERAPLLKGGFIFNVPVTHELCRADFILATLWDIACSINENYNSLCSVTPDIKNYIWVCGGGMESKTLRAFIAALTGKEIRIRENFRHASAIGGAMLCNKALKTPGQISSAAEYLAPQHEDGGYDRLYDKWKQNRNSLKQMH